MNKKAENFNHLTVSEQKEFYRKADYLISNGYYSHLDLEELAKKIFEKQKKI